MSACQSCIGPLGSWKGQDRSAGLAQGCELTHWLLCASPSAHLGKHSRRGKIICQLYHWSGSKYVICISLSAYRTMGNNLYHTVNWIWLLGLGFILLYATSVLCVVYWLFLKWIFFTPFSSIINQTGSYFQLIGVGSSYLLEKTKNVTGDSGFLELLLIHPTSLPKPCW